LKKAVVNLFDARADEHELGHQDCMANRYVLRSRHGARVEIMFEKSAETSANFWCLRAAAGWALIADLAPRTFPSTALWTKRNQNGELLYGRHSALEKMPQLGKADLVRFELKHFNQAEKIIERLQSLTPADLA
jgi:hypothetical protein